jgi:hypothetical protein
MSRTVFQNEIIALAIKQWMGGPLPTNMYRAGFIPNDFDPSGLLDRSQVEWLVQNYLGESDFDIGAASQREVADRIRQIKDKLRKQFPDNRWGNGADWTFADDAAFQRLLNNPALRKPGGLNAPGFPGNTYDPCKDCSQIADWIDEARKLFNYPGIDDATVVSWIMTESKWDLNASAYGWSAGKSSAQGLGQVTMSTYNALQASMPKPLNQGWNTATSMAEDYSLATSLYVLANKPGSSVYDKLAAYKGPGGDKYVERIKAGADLVRKALGGKSLKQLDAAACQKLLSELDRTVHP